MNRSIAVALLAALAAGCGDDNKKQPKAPAANDMFDKSKMPIQAPAGKGAPKDKKNAGFG